MDRREFLSKAAMAAALVGVTVTVTRCGGDDPAAPTTGTGDVTGTASIDHPHTGVITKAQLDAGVAVTITFTGSGHPHGLALTDSEVQSIAQGTRVQKDFTDTQNPNAASRHRHLYTFN
ncbi:MAG TPA: twin-arginine translocation signal domain-containing protein [Candidatus Krumholzibacteria bacterium]|jgi:hypothetical protein|nr:twin-arginine translocation signal domain-containing protein [Candidatus Krumholzibacteria bacterium]